jgi:hypothetical protein
MMRGLEKRDRWDRALPQPRIELIGFAIAGQESLELPDLQQHAETEIVLR